MTYSIPLPSKGKKVVVSEVANFATEAKSVAPLVRFCASQGFVYDDVYDCVMEYVERATQNIASRSGLINIDTNIIRTALLSEIYR